LQHDPAALSWYARAIELNDMQLEWQARAALRAQDWKTLVAAVDRMAKDGLDPTWRYWKGRALKASGQVAQAQALFKPLAQEYNFYGQLAQEELGGQVTTPDVGFTPTTADIELMGKNPAIKRALALVAMGLKVEANREWMWAIRDFEDKQLLIAAQLAKQADFPDWAINTAEKTVTLHDFRLRYLTPYESSLKIQSQRQSLDEAWVLGLIRQESRFNPQSRSGAGAMGLMQLMPATAQWVAGKMGLNDWRQRGMMDVELNLMMGTYYLRHVHDFLDNSLVMASAAYNAGPNKVRTWRPERAMEAAVWVETIPFSETRRYVKVVMANASYYAHLLTQQPQSLRSRMGEVRPAPSDEKPLGDTP
ncbi:MAG: transglycosylase SLT domain-containing protein, partial [Betaproteobacteria bacterium]